MRGALALAALAAGAAPAGAAVRLLEAGLVCPAILDSGETRAAPDTQTGFIDVLREGVAFDLPDRTVPLMPDLGFGVRVALKDGAPAQEVTIVVEHPPTGADGVTREAWTQWLDPGATSLSLFSFDHAYEMVAGTWTFSVEVAGTRMVSVPFAVGAPGAAARVEAACLEGLSA